MNKSEIHGVALVDERIVLVGKATQELDHGSPFWLCSTLHPSPTKEIFYPAKSKDDGIQWLRDVAKAEDVFECKRLSIGE